MRQNIKDLVRIVFESLPVREPIYEFGSYQVEGQAEFADLRPLFPGKEYIGCDFRGGPGVDRVEDVEKLTLEDESVGTLLMLDTLEHVRDCGAACREAHRVLRPDGVALMSSVMDFPIHSHPYDYWRFTPEAFNYLMAEFPVRIIGSQGWHRKPHTVFGIGLKTAEVPDLDLTGFIETLQTGMLKPDRLYDRVRLRMARVLTSKVKVFLGKNEFQLGLYQGQELLQELRRS